MLYLEMLGKIKVMGSWTLPDYLCDDLTRPVRLRDWHHVSGVPYNEIGEAATFGVVADQLSSSVLERNILF